MQTHYTIPDAPDNYPLDPSKGLFSVVIPEATTNLATNPSLETGTTGWTASGAVIARSTAQQRRGVYSLAVTPTSAATDGVYFGTVALVAGTTYTASVDVLGAPGVEYRLFVANTSAAAVSSIVSFTGTGRWQRVDVTYAETSSASRRVYITKRTGMSTAVFYVDGLQVEAKSYPTTYCDGDQQGLVPGQLPPAYAWGGTPHASTSSRSAQTRAGGRVASLQGLGLVVTAYTGLGMASVTIVDDAYAQGDGGVYQTTFAPARTFAVAGAISDSSFQQLQRKRAALQNVFRPDRVAVRQPLVLIYQVTDGCGNARGEPLEIVCVYVGGLEGETTNRYQEKVTIRLTMYDPYLRAAGDSGSSLGYQTSVANANGIAQRSAAGAWSPLSTGIAGGGSTSVLALASTPDGSLYVGGDFTSAGASGADYLARWDGAAFNVLGSATALTSAVNALAVGPTGLLYVGGGGLNINGNANADWIASWDGSTWAALSTGANNPVRALAVAPDGSLYAGGSFTDIGGSGADYIARWNGSAWSVLASATALNGVVRALAIGPDGNLYVGGDFTSANAVADTARIARWNVTTSAWESVGVGGANGAIYAFVVGLDGMLYAGGDFTTIGGVTANYLARYNRTSWAALGSGLSSAGAADVSALAVGPDGMVYAGGSFTIAGGVGLPDYAARWNGSAWAALDADLPSGGAAPTIRALIVSADGTLTVGSGATGTATAAAQTTITNAGSADAYPIITFTGPGALYGLRNTTIGAEIYFDLTLNAGETATLDLTPGAIAFTSSFRGNILSSIIPGSNLTAWRLISGVNTISLFIGGATTAATAATMRWRGGYWSTDDATA